MISEAFPDFNLATLPPIPSDWRDVSWQHDACPSWLVNGLHVFIDHADPAKREFNLTRFHVLSDGDDLLATDAWPEVLAFVYASSDREVMLWQDGKF